MEERSIFHGKAHFADTVLVRHGLKVADGDGAALSVTKDGVRTRGPLQVSGGDLAAAFVQGRAVAASDVPFPSQSPAAAVAGGGGAFFVGVPSEGVVWMVRTEEGAREEERCVPLRPPAAISGKVSGWGGTLHWQEGGGGGCAGVLAVGATVATQARGEVPVQFAHFFWDEPFRPVGVPLPFGVPAGASGAMCVSARFTGGAQFVEALSPSPEEGVRAYHSAARLPVQALPPPATVRDVRGTEVRLWTPEGGTFALDGRTGRAVIISPSVRGSGASLVQQGFEVCELLRSERETPSGYAFSTSPHRLVRLSLASGEVLGFALPPSLPRSHRLPNLSPAFRLSVPLARALSLSGDALFVATDDRLACHAAFVEDASWSLPLARGAAWCCPSPNACLVASGRVGCVELVRPEAGEARVRMPSLSCAGEVECSRLVIRGGTLAPAGGGELLLPAAEVRAEGCTLAAWHRGDVVVVREAGAQQRGEVASVRMDGTVTTLGVGGREGARMGERFGCVRPSPSGDGLLAVMEDLERPPSSRVSLLPLARWAPPPSAPATLPLPKHVLSAEAVACAAGAVVACACRLRSGGLELHTVKLPAGGGVESVSQPFPPLALPTSQPATTLRATMRGHELLCALEGADGASLAALLRPAPAPALFRHLGAQRIEAFSRDGHAYAVRGGECEVFRMRVETAEKGGVAFHAAGGFDVRSPLLRGTASSRVTCLCAADEEGCAFVFASRPPRLFRFQGGDVLGVWSVSSAFGSAVYDGVHGLAASCAEEGVVAVFPPSCLRSEVVASAVRCSSVGRLRVADMPYAWRSEGKVEGEEDLRRRVERLEGEIERLLGVLSACGVVALA